MQRLRFLPAFLLPLLFASPVVAGDAQTLVDAAHAAAASGHATEAYAKAGQALAALQGMVKWNDVANLDMLLVEGEAALALNKRDEAEAAYRQVEERTRLLAPHPDQRLPSLAARARALSGLASLLEAAGKIEAAEPLLRKAQVIVARNFEQGDALRAQISTHLANLLQSLGKTDEAQGLLKEAGDDPFARPLALKTEALAAQAAGDFDTAISLLREAAARVDALQPASDAAVSFHTDLGNMQIAAERYADAEETLRHAVALCVTEDCAFAAAQARASLAYVLAALERWDACYEEALEAARVVDAWLGSLAVQDDRGFDAAFIHDLVSVAAWQVMQAHPERQDEMMAAAFAAMQMNQAPKAANALLLMAARKAADDPSIAALVRQVQDQQSAFASAEATELGKAGASGVSTRLLYSGAGGSLKDKLQTAMTDLKARFPEYEALAGMTPLALDDVPPLLGPDQALVIPYVGRSQIDANMVWVITSERIWWQPIDATGLLDKVSALRKQLDPATGTRGVVDASTDDDAAQPTGFDTAPFAAVYQQLFGGVDDALSSRPRLIIVPSPALAALPFEALAKSPATKADDPRTADWLIRHAAVSVLPSVASLKSVADLSSREDQSKSFAGYGNPLVAGSDLAPLPGTVEELNTLANSLGGMASVTLAEKATPEAVQAADLSRTTVLAFATHGLLPGQAEGLNEPALVLSPDSKGHRFLTASDVAHLKLNAELVILSACNTAGGDATTGEGYAGLARAFLYAGARALLVSHWPVFSDAAVNLTTRTVKGLSNGLPRDVALQKAMLAIVDGDVEPRHWRPDYWAPFVLIGAAGP